MDILKTGTHNPYVRPVRMGRVYRS